MNLILYVMTWLGLDLISWDSTLLNFKTWDSIWTLFKDFRLKLGIKESIHTNSVIWDLTCVGFEDIKIDFD